MNVKCKFTLGSIKNKTHFEELLDIEVSNNSTMDSEVEESYKEWVLSNNTGTYEIISIDDDLLFDFEGTELND